MHDGYDAPNQPWNQARPVEALQLKSLFGLLFYMSELLKMSHEQHTSQLRQVRSHPEERYLIREYEEGK